MHYINLMKIKKHCTGNGKASKEEVLSAVREKYGYTGSSFDCADAIALWHYAKNQF